MTSLSPISVLFVIPTLKGGGAERVFVTLLRHLDRTKFQLTLMLLDGNDAVYLDDVPSDVEVVILDCPRTRQALAKLLRTVWHRRPDVVFSTLGHLNLTLAMLRPLMPSRTVFIGRETVMVSMLSSIYKAPFWWNWGCKVLLGRLDKIVCQSQSMRTDLMRHYGLAAEKLIVVRNPVDASRIQRLAVEPIETGMARGRQIEEGVIELVAAGSMDDTRKGFDLLIEALAMWGNDRARLTILGQGRLTGQLQKLAASRGVGSRVRFVPFQKNPFVYFAQADAFVLSSRFEGVPNVVLEALACGTPVISTPAPGGVCELLAEIEGCVVTATITAAALAQTFQKFQFGRRISKDALDSYSPDVVARSYEPLFSFKAPAGVPHGAP